MNVGTKFSQKHLVLKYEHDLNKGTKFCRYTTKTWGGTENRGQQKLSTEKLNYLMRIY